MLVKGKRVSKNLKDKRKLARKGPRNTAAARTIAQNKVWMEQDTKVRRRMPAKAPAANLSIAKQSMKGVPKVAAAAKRKVKALKRTRAPGRLKRTPKTWSTLGRK